jgi:hypothetical protein
MTQVTLTFSGLCCAAPHADYLDVILADGGAMAHQPRLVIATAFVAPDQHSDEIVVANGVAYSVWKLDGKNLSVGPKRDGAGVVLKHTPTAQRPSPRPGQESDVLWIPSLTELTRAPLNPDMRRYSSASADRVAAAVRATAGGTLESWIGSTKVWKFGLFEQVVADAIVYRFETAEQVVLSADGLSVSLLDPKKIEVAAFSIDVSNLPPHRMAPGSGMEHFRRFYGLLEGEPDGPLPTNDDAKRYGDLVQCGTGRVD